MRYFERAWKERERREEEREGREGREAGASATDGGGRELDGGGARLGRNERRRCNRDGARAGLEKLTAHKTKHGDDARDQRC